MSLFFRSIGLLFNVSLCHSLRKRSAPLADKGPARGRMEDQGGVVFFLAIYSDF